MLRLTSREVPPQGSVERREEPMLGITAADEVTGRAGRTGPGDPIR